MGIQGLLSFVKHKESDKSAINSMHVNDLSGKVAAIDGYCWLHKAAFGCAYDLFHKKPTTKYVDYCIKLLQMLKHYRIKPILVFDGAKVPIKVVNETRREHRQNAKKQALTLIAAGRANEAFNHIVSSIEVTHEMVHNLIRAAREIGVDSIVAPFEADAQLAYLEKSGHVDFIITEDSDLIVFGCKKIFFKMDKNGRGEFYNGDKLEESLKTKSVKFSEFNFDKFRRAAILSGCDYVKNLPGIGLVKAWKFMNLTDNEDLTQSLKKIPHYMNLKLIVDDEYIENFIMAEYAFLYQTVFDPRSKQRVPMNAIDCDDNTYKIFAKKFKTTRLDSFQLALGNIDHNNKVYDDYTPTDNNYTIFSQKSPKKSLPKPKSNKAAFEFKTITKRPSISEDANSSILEHDENSSDLLNYYKNVEVKSKIEEEVVVEEPPKKKVRSSKFVRVTTSHVYQSKYFTRSSKDEEIVDELIKNEKSEITNLGSDADEIPETPDTSIEATIEEVDNDKKVGEDLGEHVNNEFRCETPENLEIEPDLPESPSLLTFSAKMDEKTHKPANNKRKYLSDVVNVVELNEESNDSEECVFIKQNSEVLAPIRENVNEKQSGYGLKENKAGSLPSKLKINLKQSQKDKRRGGSDNCKPSNTLFNYFKKV